MFLKRLLSQMRQKMSLCGNGLIAVQMMIGVTDRVEKIVGKGENAGYQHFLLFPQCFQKASFPGLFKAGILTGKKLTLCHRIRTFNNRKKTKSIS